MRIPQIFLNACLLAGAVGCAGPAPERPAVGAIRWDAWSDGNDYNHFLEPEAWRSRLPFYSHVDPQTHHVSICSDSDEILKREIALAREAGLDYWAVCYYHPKAFPGSDRYNHAWKRLAALPPGGGMSFCLILLGPCLGPKEAWPDTADTLISLFRKPSYRKVAGGRPLVYVFSLPGLEKTFGSWAEARAAFDLLKAKTREAGLPAPYVAAQVFNAKEGKRFADLLGLDAVSAYSQPGSGPHEERPYARLAEANVTYWNECLATGKKVIPIVNAGWDGRPRLGDPDKAKHYRGPWFLQPAPQELADHLRHARVWSREHAEACDAGTVLIYAWNESDEGGWLVPTLAEGNARLEAIGKVLNAK